MIFGLPRSDLHIAHGYTLADVYDLAARAVRTDYWRPSIAWTERVEAAWSAISSALLEAEEPPRRAALIIIARDASNDVIASDMRHHGIDTRSATFGESRANFERYWRTLARTPLEDRVVDGLAIFQIWVRLKPDLQDALVALASHGDYSAAADAMGLGYYAFCARVSRARKQFLRLWHDGEAPSRVWGNDKRQGRDTGKTAVRVLAQRRRNRKYKEAS